MSTSIQPLSSQVRHVTVQHRGAPAAQRDSIRIKDLAIYVSFASQEHGLLRQPEAERVLVSLTMVHDTWQAARTDDLRWSIDYSSVARTALQSCDALVVPSLQTLLARISQSCYGSHPEVQQLSIRASTALRPDSTVGIEIDTTRECQLASTGRVFVEDLECQTIVGVNPEERHVQQPVRFSVLLDTQLEVEKPFDLQGLVKAIQDDVTPSAHSTLEALASSVAHTALVNSGDKNARIAVRVVKPKALAPTAKATEVEVSRTICDYEGKQLAMGDTVVSSVHPSFRAAAQTNFSSLLASVAECGKILKYPHRAAIALGANLGDRLTNIELALRLLETPGGRISRDSGPPRAVVVDTSFMYETAPMYITDQPKFINCACIIETDLRPRELLEFVKDIEVTVGRVASFRNGPRAIDLDILTYDSEIIDSRLESQRSTLDNLAGELVVPHPRIAEREFVLRPLDDMIPDFVLPTSGESIHELLSTLVASQGPDTAPMYKVTPFPLYPFSAHPPSRSPSPSLVDLPLVPATAAYWTYPVRPSRTKQQRKTYIMGTLNVTPDSFSDGSKHNKIPAALAYATSSATGGAAIIDIGGYSTRPGAEFVSPEEEIARVVPVIEAIRDLQEDVVNVSPCVVGKTATVLISIDTFRPDVAAPAIRAGANCLNDVYAFVGPEYPLTQCSAEHFLEMRRVARELSVPVVLMHSRGEASANKDYSAYEYAAGANGWGAVLEGVRMELGERVEAAVKGAGGIRRWNVIVDPGIGFSKTVEGNLELLREASKLTTETRLYHSSGEMKRNILAGYPQLIGSSRKSFLGTILARPDDEGSYEGRETKADERSWATAAAVACAVQQRAEVIRVHDVLELGDVVRVSSALWS